MAKLIYLGFAVIELNGLHLFETFHDRLQPYFGQEDLQLLYLDTDSFVLSMNTRDIIKQLKNLEDLFHLVNLDENHELFSEKNKKLLEKWK